MKSFPQALIDELAAEEFHPIRLLEVQTSTPVYYTDHDLDLTIGGKTYLSRGQEGGTIHMSLSPEVDRTTIEIDNVDLTMSAFAMGAEDWRGKTAIVSLACLTAPTTIAGNPEPLFTGIVGAMKVDHKKAILTLYSHMIFWKRPVPRLRYSPYCPWQFKGASPVSLCRYAGGETWCDQTYDRCLTLGNTANFGGDRWLPSLVNKHIQWGPK